MFDIKRGENEEMNENLQSCGQSISVHWDEFREKRNRKHKKRYFVIDMEPIGDSAAL